MGKIIPLEGLRGIASVIVVFHHFVLAFFPLHPGMFEDASVSAVFLGSPLLVFINGAAAVTVFFTLSGYVLAFAAFRDDPISAVGFSAAKRWFRLIGPVCVSVLLSYVFFEVGAYRFQDAAQLTSSEWLGTFAQGHVTQDFDPTIWQALNQSLWRTFFIGDSYFNTNIWTMKWEFWGSFLVFGASLFLATSVPKFAQLFIFAILGLLTFINGPYLFPFVVGVCLHVFSIGNLKIGKYAALLLLLVGLYLSGYIYMEGPYAWLRLSPFGSERTTILVHTAGSTFFIVLLASKNRISDMCQNSTFGFLGQISFSLYLLHTILIMSVASFIFISLHEIVDVRLNLIITFLGLIAILVPATLLLSSFDQWWLRTVNRTGKMLFRRSRTTHERPS